MTENPDENAPKEPFNIFHFVFRKHLPLEKETSLFILVNALDLFMTYVLIKREGFREANPIANWFIEGWGLINGMTMYKFSMVAFVGVIAQIVARKKMKLGKFVLNFGTVVVSCVVIYSLLLLLGQVKSPEEPIKDRKGNTNVERKAEPMASLEKSLSNFGQEHVLRYWEELNEEQQTRLQQQIEALDLELVESVFRIRMAASSAENNQHELQPPSHLVRLPASESDREAHRLATEKGKQLLEQRKVAGLLVAGGQGTRLGFEHPKGMFPLGPQSDCTLFEIFAKQLQQCSAQFGNVIPWYIMTSDATHDETLRFFKENDSLGYPEEQIQFFRQGNMPALDETSGKLLLESRSSLCLSPDGHGGMLQALDSCGVLAEMQSNGIEQLFYWQVDNPTTIVCDPAFLGVHVLNHSNASTKVVAKRSWDERVGLLVDIEKKTQIIEYSNLSDDLAQQTNPDSTLKFWAGNTAIHIFDVAFLREQSHNAQALPFHLAHKTVSFLNDDGIVEDPETPNALKMERFIFDLLPQAEVALVVETDREREFNPVKNATGDDSPETACRAMQRIFPGWS